MRKGISLFVLSVVCAASIFFNFMQWSNRGYLNSLLDTAYREFREERAMANTGPCGWKDVETVTFEKNGKTEIEYAVAGKIVNEYERSLYSFNTDENGTFRVKKLGKQVMERPLRCMAAEIQTMENRMGR